MVLGLIFAFRIPLRVLFTKRAYDIRHLSARNSLLFLFAHCLCDDERLFGGRGAFFLDISGQHLRIWLGSNGCFV